jgi:general secretion pathway protein L
MGESQQSTMAAQGGRSLDRLGQAVDLRGLFAWWRESLVLGLPPWLRRGFEQQLSRLVIEMIGGSEWLVSRETADGIKALGRFDEADPRIVALTAAALGEESGRHQVQLVLRLPQQMILSTTLSLPLAAEENLRQVLAFEMDRYSPFTTQEVFFDFQVLERRPDLQRIRVKMILARREEVEQVLQRFAERGLRPSVVDVAGQGPGLNLLPVERRPAPQRSGRALTLVLAVLALGLFVVASLAPVWHMRSVVVDLQPQVASVRQEAEQTRELEAQLQEAIQSTGFLVQEKMRHPVVVEVLDELTRYLPDDTWVQRFELRGNELQVRGESFEASALIGLVEGSSLFSEVSFRSSVTRNPQSGSDRFHLVATVKQGLRP